MFKLWLYYENSHLGHNEGTLAMKEGEILYIIEEDKGDGWTRARRQNGEEGYVPTSYIDVTLEKNSKGAVTYIWTNQAALWHRNDNLKQKHTRWVG